MQYSGYKRWFFRRNTPFSAKKTIMHYTKSKFLVYILSKNTGMCGMNHSFLFFLPQKNLLY